MLNDIDQQVLSYQNQIIDAKNLIGQQQMQIQTLQAKNDDFIDASHDRDRLITSMQHDIGQLRDEKKHLLGLIQELKTKAVETFTECRSLNEENAKLKN